MMGLLQAPIDAFHWSLALVPLIVLLVLLVGLRWQAPEAGPIGMFIAAGIALAAFQTPWETLAVASGKGVWDAIFILYVVWPALLLYHVIKRAGGFVALEDGIQTFSDNELFLILAFGWVFASFLQGIAGFGTPIAVVAPLLLILGVRPVYAVAIPLIGHAWANMFGTLAVAWLATIRVVTLELLLETAVQAAVLLWVPTLAAGIAIAWLYGRWSAVSYALPMILVISTIHGGVQLAVMFWDPVLSTFIAATLALLALYPLSRWERYDQPLEEFQDSKAMSRSVDTGGQSGAAVTDGGQPRDDESTDGSGPRDNGETADGGDRSDDGEVDGDDAVADSDDKTPEPVMSFWMSLLPYVVLTVVAIAALAVPQIEAVLEQFEVGLSFPAVETGYGVETPAEEPYSPFAPLTHPGSFLIVSLLAGWLVYRVRGYYSQWADREEVDSIWAGLADDAVPASVAIVAFLVMAQVMVHAGQMETLAFGIALVAPPVVYIFSSSWIGFIGAFMTSSNTASNILLSPLHDQAVDALPELSQASIIAGQSAGGAVGNAIAPANVVLGTGAVGAIGKEGDVLRITIPWTVIVMVIVGGLTIAIHGLGLTGGL